MSFPLDQQGIFFQSGEKKFAELILNFEKEQNNEDF